MKEIKRQALEHRLKNIFLAFEDAFEDLRKTFEQFPDAVRFDRADSLKIIERGITNLISSALEDLANGGS